MFEQRLWAYYRAYIILAMKVHELGEFGLIELIADIVGSTTGPDLVLGIGDDAAAWRAEGAVQLGTTDTLVEGVHFTLDTATWRELGWKALAINVSDIAAMGGRPLYALVSLGLPPETEVDSVSDFCRGMAEMAAEYEVAICGGNISSAPVMMVNVTVIGEASGAVLTRSAAMPGDRIAVTGYLGQAAAGLKMLRSGLAFDPETDAFLRKAHLRPCPRVAEGLILVQQGVRAAIDLSDGLVSDLSHIAKASRVAARVWVRSLPVHPLVRGAFGEEASGLAISGGEDYELLFTAKDAIIGGLKDHMPSQVTVIGEITGGEPGQVTLCDERGEAIDWEQRGWEHFKASG